LGCAGMFGQTVFLFSFENTETVTTDNAVGTPTFTASGVDMPSYFAGSTGQSRSHANWQTGDYYRFTVNTTGYSSLNFSYFSRSSNAAVGTFIARVSTDASNWTTIVSSYTPSTSFAQRTAALPAGFANQAEVYIEVYKTNNADDPGRNIRIDEALLTGTVSADVTPPTVTTFNPADNATGVAINSNLVLTFNENVVEGTAGNFVIYNADTTVFESIPFNDGRITRSGAVVTINPTATFVNSANYYVRIDNTAIRDVALNAYAGISNNTTWNFTAEAPTTIIWTNPITGTDPGLISPYTTGDVNNANITVSGITRGSGINGNVSFDRYNANDWNSVSLNTNDYFEFTLTPNTGYEINFIDFVYTSERSNTSIANFAFRSIVDSYTANIGTPNSTGTTISLSGAAYQNRTTATTFRIYAWGADAATRTFSINDFTFNGTVIQTTLATDFFRSRASGTWATAGNWESSRDNTNWITSTLAPTSAANTITIRDLHTITISDAVTADQITVESGGTLALNGADLTLNNGNGTDLTINIGGTFDNGGENQITSSGSIAINGKFITRDIDGFVGPNTSITLATRSLPTLGSSSTIEYGFAGDQEVQGSTAPSYQNVTFSGTGTKTLQSTNAVTGTVTIKDAAIFNSTSFTFGGAGTNLTMTDTSRLIVSGARPVPDMGGTYTLTGGTIEFAGNSNSHTARSPITYNNVVISGSNVNGSAGNYTLKNGATFTVNSGGVFTVSDQRIIAGGAFATINVNGNFVTKDADGFYGTSATSISPTNTILNLGSASTIEYAGANQSITTVPASTAYANLTVSGTGIKTIPTQLFLGNNLLVNASTLRIESGKALTVTNKVDVNTAATMIIENSGSLVQVNDAAVNSGNVTYERNYKGIEWDDYTYWSSPVFNQNLYALSPDTKLDKFFSFDADITVDWKLENPLTTAMEVGKGYIIRAASWTGPPPGFLKNSFVGVPNNGEKLVPIYWRNSDPLGTSNLIGNPYPSAIDAVKFLTTNAGVIESTIYFWTNATSLQNRNLITGTNPDGTPKAGTGELAYTTDDYASFNLVGGVGVAAGNIIPGTPPTEEVSNKPNGKIAAGQAFFTTSLKTNTTSNATFNNSMRLDNANAILDNSQFFKTRNPTTKTTAFEKHRIWLNLTNTQGVFKQTLVGYITDATNQYDSRFDGISFDGNEFVDFYSVNQEKNLVIQGRALPFDKNDHVPLGFRTTITGTFTIKIDQADGVLTNQPVFIEDKLTNTTFDLRSGPFTFNTVAGTFNDRFVLRYTNKTLGTNDLETLENQVLVSNKNKQIKINSKVEPIDKVMVYDLLGRQLFKKDKVNSNELSILNLISNAQTLLVKVTLQNGETVTRKIVF